MCELVLYQEKYAMALLNSGLILMPLCGCSFYDSPTALYPTFYMVDLFDSTP